MMEFKTVVSCLKLLTYLIVQRRFGNILYYYVQKYSTLKMDTLRKYEKDQDSGIGLNVLYKLS